MQNASVFVDTNILVYAHDRSAGDKYLMAKEKVLSLWQHAIPPAVSVQVLQELYVTLVRKKLSAKECKEFVADYMQWTVISNDPPLLMEGISLTERWKISMWDGLIIAAAQRANASVIWSEDLNDGQNYGGVRVINPLR
ncbi:MAG TPA: PIN domain-containing protein [Tepidisphaeraceae bacterium]|jgi:predicted nucleic acid-binding protein|nr:PIN domain-containing protein [Tepidisphaeraceae bacterium]